MAVSAPFVEPHTGTRWWHNDLSDSFSTHFDEKRQ
jgi:hypothetical protein